MKLIILAIIMLVSALPQAALQAQESGAASAPLSISADQAVELAIRNNLGLESSRTTLESKRRASNMSWNQFIPNVTVAGILNRSNDAQTHDILYPVDMADIFNPIFASAGLPPAIGIPPETIYGVSPLSLDLPQWNLVGNVQASVNLSLSMFSNMKRLRLDYETGLLSYERAKLQLERDVRKAYHNILLLQQNIAVIHGSFANVERQVQMAQANFNAGLAPEIVLLQARVARENMRPIIDQIENGLRLSMAQFAMFLGLDYNTQFELIPVTDSTNFIPLDVSEMITKAARNKPDIQELRHTILMMNSARKIQTHALYPALNLSWNNSSVFLKDPWKDFNTNFDSDRDWRHSGSFSITLAWRLHSLIPFSTDIQGIKALNDQITTANIGLAQMVVGTEIEVYNTVLSLERTRINAEAQAQTVALAERSYRLTEQAYRAGLQDYFQVQNAEQSLRQARVQLLEQQFNYLNGLIDLEYSIGVPFGTLSK